MEGMEGWKMGYLPSFHPSILLLIRQFRNIENERR